MLDINTLWENTCMLLKKEMAPVSYETWIAKTLAPYRLDGNMLILTATATYLRVIVQKSYSGMITKCLSQVAGMDMNITVMDLDKVSELPETLNGNNDGIASDMHQRLNPKYTFNRFVVGGGNRLAQATSLAVAEHPGEIYNPLFIYGGVGLGKTHLMHAIGNFIMEADPSKQVMCISSEQFMIEMIDAIKNNANAEFRNRFRNVDVLLVDDIQFIAGREATQEEFFHTFEALHGAGKQIVMTSDKPPKEIAKLEERLCSRFQWGMTVDIQRPDIDTRIAILRTKAEQEHYDVGLDVLELIASNVDSNVRELEGSLIRLVAYAKLVNKPITVSLCDEGLREVFDKSKPRQITADIVIRTVAEYFGIPAEDMVGKSRRKELTNPRQIAMYLVRELLGLSQPRIGMLFGGRDHTTVIYSCNLVAENMKKSSDLANAVDDIRRMIRESK